MVGVEGQAHVLQVLVAGLVVVPRVPDAFTGGERLRMSLNYIRSSKIHNHFINVH